MLKIWKPCYNFFLQKNPKNSVVSNNTSIECWFIILLISKEKICKNFDHFFFGKLIILSKLSLISLLSSSKIRN